MENKQVVDNTVGIAKKERRFTYIPEPHTECPQRILWGWLRHYGRVTALPVYLENCSKCRIGQAKACPQLAAVRKAVAVLRENKSPTSHKDSDCLIQMDNFIRDNSTLLDEAWKKNETFAEQTDIWVATKEAVALLGGDVRSLHELVSSGILTPVPSGNQRLYKKSDVLAAKDLVPVRKRRPMKSGFPKYEKANPELILDGVRFVSRFRAAELLGVAMAEMTQIYPRFATREIDAEGHKVYYHTFESVRKAAQGFHRARRENAPILKMDSEPAPTPAPVDAPEPEPTPQPEPEIPEVVETTQEEWPFLSDILDLAEHTLQTEETGIFSGQRIGLLDRLDRDFLDVRDTGFSTGKAIRIAAHLVAWLKDKMEEKNGRV